MRLTYIPLLKVQRELHNIPRGPARFQHYLRTILTADRNDIELPPLGIMNPMGKEHVSTLLDKLLELNADDIAEESTQEAATRLANIPGDYKASVVVADDAMGGGTNRFAYEFDLRFGPARVRYRTQKRYWITAVLWTSEEPTEKAVREAVLTATYRTGYVLQNGPARNLREMLAQEGYVMSLAGCTAPTLDPDKLEETRHLISRIQDADDMRTAIECLFGDDAGSTLGFTPRGIGSWGGLALALEEARAGTLSG